ncbi:MAG: hypothetical protein IPF51_03665 [Dehalococcoidia bacterium]|uniref:hypothetical protein n=1 Tax=Candidatus Amarobacter glycogenicus TaxID=3140699 RepID=UPI003136FD15|nr:hypothetical protein [Dehalococcoidia bacterium]
MRLGYSVAVAFLRHTSEFVCYLPSMSFNTRLRLAVPCATNAFIQKEHHHFVEPSGTPFWFGTA